MLLTILILAIIIVTFSVLGLGLNIIFRKGRKFPETSVGHNKEMQNRGITCARHDEIRAYNEQKKNRRTREELAELTACDGCHCADESS